MIAAIQKRVFWVWSAFLYIFIVTPLICVILASFNQESVQSVPPLQWSLRWYGEALRNPNFVRGALTSSCGCDGRHDHRHADRRARRLRALEKQIPLQGGT